MAGALQNEGVNEAVKTRIPRSLTIKNLFEQKPYRYLQFEDQAFTHTIGTATEARGVWIIYGMEKNGKTSFALQLAKDLAVSEKVCYISAEENANSSFVANMRRAGINTNDKKLIFDRYLGIETIVEKFSRPKQADVIFIDNLTIYKDELRKIAISKVWKQLPNKLIVFISHEKNNEPDMAAGREIKKLASVICQVVGLKAFVTSRNGPGGEVDIIDDKAELFHGRS